MSQEPNHAELSKLQYQHKALTSFSNKRILSAWALTARPTGAGQEPNLAEILTSRYQLQALTFCLKSKRLGVYSGADRREPGARSRRNPKIAIPA